MRNVPVILAAILLCVSVGAVAQEKDVPYQAGPNNAITDVPGVEVGHFTYHKDKTYRGATVILFGPSGGLCADDVRGGNPFTIDTDSFNPTTIATECDAIVLTGGSAFGAAAEVGVMNYLFEHGRGVETRAGRIPIVPAAVIFDLPVGDANVHPELSWGYKAAESAKGGPVEQGNVGAGAGGTMGKAPGGIPMKGGLGTASAVLPGGITVGAIVVINALGDVVNPATGELYAVGGGFDRVPLRVRSSPSPKGPASAALENTTLAVITTNARLNKTQLTKVAQLAHDGLARAIRPVHTMLDGDVIFAVSVGWDNSIPLQGLTWGEDVDQIGSAAADVLVHAILNGVNAADSIPGWTSYRDWKAARGAEKKK
jgi:L-aminopeptidase/D-esterase-like protein